MKHILFITAILTLLVSLCWAQTVRIVNNNLNRPTGANVYSTLQAAIDAAVAGDIIQIVGSPTSYGSANVTKRLSIFGIGLNPNKDIPVKSTMDYLNLQNTNSANSSGSVVSGINPSTISVGYVPSGVAVALNNITIEKCLFSSSITFYPGGALISGVIIRGCQLEGQFYSNDPSNMSNIIVTNCFIKSYLSNMSNTIFKNCVIGDNNYNFALASSWIRDCIFNNNIFYGVTVYNQTIERCVFSNNIIFPLITAKDTLVPAGTGIGNSGFGNMNNVDPQFATTGFYVLSSSSPAKNAGSDGTDIGLYGGTTPFDYAGMPLPYIQLLNTSSAVSKGGNLNVQVKAKGVK